MKHFISILLINITFIHLYGQSAPSANQFHGYIIFEDGTRQDVALDVEDINEPWTFHKEVKYFSRDLLDGRRISRDKKTTIHPDNIIEFGFDNRVFRPVEYFVQKENEPLNKAWQKVTGKGLTTIFAELIYVENGFELFKVFPIPFMDDYEEDNNNSAMILESKNKFDILIAKKDYKPKSCNDVELTMLFADCQFVVDKFTNEKYTLKPKSKLKKALNNDQILGEKLEVSIKKMLSDYSTKCGKN